jgi:hypothetical protein
LRPPRRWSARSCRTPLAAGQHRRAAYLGGLQATRGSGLIGLKTAGRGRRMSYSDRPSIASHLVGVHVHVVAPTEERPYRTLAFGA